MNKLNQTAVVQAHRTSTNEARRVDRATVIVYSVLFPERKT